MIERKGEVTYRIRKVGKKSGDKNIHINNLLKFVERAEVNRLDVVIEDEECEK